MNKTTSIAAVNPNLFALVTGALSSLHVPAISAYDLSKLAYIKAHLQESIAPKKEFERLINALVAVKLLEPLDTFNAFLVFGHRTAPPSEIACCIDPFAYVSHLSAMEHHGLTDRFAKTLYLTRPSPMEWRKQAASRMEKDLGEGFKIYQTFGLPLLKRLTFTAIRDTTVHFQERSQLGAFRNVSNSCLRVATIGRVFLDMLREPKLCGGIQHILDIYKRDAKRYLRLIVEEIDRHGQPIDKVRAGYVLTEVCRLSHPTISNWRIHAQRGGSRKLDPDSEFSSVYSEDWMLSINVPALTAERSEYDDHT